MRGQKKKCLINNKYSSETTCEWSTRTTSPQPLRWFSALQPVMNLRAPWNTTPHKRDMHHRDTSPHLFLSVFFLFPKTTRGKLLRFFPRVSLRSSSSQLESVFVREARVFQQLPSPHPPHLMEITEEDGVGVGERAKTGRRNVRWISAGTWVTPLPITMQIVR